MKEQKYFSTTTSTNPFTGTQNEVRLELEYKVPSEKYPGTSLVTMEFEPFRDAFLDNTRTLIEIRDNDNKTLQVLTVKSVNHASSETPKTDEVVWFPDLVNASSEIWINSLWTDKNIYISSYFRNAVLSADKFTQMNHDLYNMEGLFVWRSIITTIGTSLYVPIEKTRLLRVILTGGGGGGAGGTKNGNSGGDTIAFGQTKKGAGGGVWYGAGSGGGSAGSFGGGGNGIMNTAMNGENGKGYGTGGGGTGVSSSRGGQGGSFGCDGESTASSVGGFGTGPSLDFCILVKDIADFNVTVGAGGAGGTNGTYKGGDGAQGCIEIEEYT